jgi:hypothetical protein
LCITLCFKIWLQIQRETRISTSFCTILSPQLFLHFYNHV